MVQIDFIKEEMKNWFGFELTNQQVEDFLIQNPISYSFDTVEREKFADYLALKITGMPFPMNGDSQERKNYFYSELKKNSLEMGYICKID